jgi:Tol biopolymer transport system component
VSRRWSLLAAFLITAVWLVGAAPARATYPGPNGRIAFTDYTRGQIFAVDPDGGGLKRLSDVGQSRFPSWPDWSPNGHRLLFTADGGADRGAPIMVVRADGSHERVLIRDAKGFRDYEPNFTPSGRGIVFARCKPNDGVCAIWRMRLNGSHKHALTPYREGAKERVDFDPSVAPSGKRIAFTRFGAGGIGSRIYVMASDGSHPHPITPAPLEASSPDWAPNGKRIVFSTNSQRTGSSVFSIRPKGAGLRRLTAERYPHNDALASYSPRGNKIAFVSDRNYPDACCNDFFEMDPLGANEHVVDIGRSNPGVLWPAWGTHPLAP